MFTLGIKSLVPGYQYRMVLCLDTLFVLCTLHVSNFKGGFSSMPFAILFASWGCKMTT